MKTFDLDRFGKTYAIRLEVNAYHYGGNLAIQMISHEDGIAEPWSSLTVNLDSALPLNCAYIDVNNNGGDILQWIERHGLAFPTGRYGYSGFCRYPEYIFDEKLIREIDPTGYEKYLYARERCNKRQKTKSKKTAS